MSKPRDIKKGLMDLRLNQAMKLKGGALSLSPPATFVAGDSKESLVSNTSRETNLSPFENQPQDRRPSLDHLHTQDADSFKDEKVTWDTKSSSVRNTSRDLAQTTVSIRSVDTISTMDSGESTVPFESKDRQISEDQNVSEDKIRSSVRIESSDSVEPRIERKRISSRKATEQDSSVVFANKESSGLRSGFTRISNQLLMDILEGDLSKAEIKILLLIARFTTSFQKEFAPISKTVVERYTHLQGKSVLDAMTSLEQHQRIQKLQGDARSPNQLGLAKRYAVGEFVKTPPDKNPPRDKKASAGESSVPDRFASDIKDIKNINKYSLSQNSEELREYFENLKPRAKRDEELRIFGELKQDFPEEQIAECYRHLRKHGSLKTGDECHSPMAYLAKAFTQVLAEATKAQEKAHNDARLRQQAQQLEADQRRQQEHDELQAKKVAELFKAAFPDEASQQAKIQELVSRHFDKSPMPRSILERIAVFRWFETEAQNGGMSHA